VQIKANSNFYAELERITYDGVGKRAFFTLKDYSETFAVSASTSEQDAQLALSREGDRVAIGVGELPPLERICYVLNFSNLDC
jgi:hypothetical protein